MVTACNCGGEIMNSSPNFDNNDITQCRDYALYYTGHCGGNLTSNVIAHNGDHGIYIYADPPLAAPDFNGSWLPEEANDFYENHAGHIWYDHSPGDGFVMALYNYWGSPCPDFATKIHGEVNYSPWMDSVHEQVLDEDDCPDGTKPSTWGAIKGLFR